MPLTLPGLEQSHQLGSARLHGTYSHCVPLVPRLPPVPSTGASIGAKGCASCRGRRRCCYFLLHPKPRLNMSPDVESPALSPSRCLDEIRDSQMPLPTDLWNSWGCLRFQQTQHPGCKSDPSGYRDLPSADAHVKFSINGFSHNRQGRERQKSTFPRQYEQGGPLPPHPHLPLLFISLPTPLPGSSCIPKSPANPAAEGENSLPGLT